MTNEEINFQYSLTTEREKSISIHITAIADLERNINHVSDYASEFDLEQLQIELQSHRNALHKLTGLPHDIKISDGKKTPDFVSMIGDLIRNYVSLSEAPYSQNGEMEINSSSVDEAAQSIFNMLKRNGFTQNG